jgi:hypothetical protein
MLVRPIPLPVLLLPLFTICLMRGAIMGPAFRLHVNSSHNLSIFKYWPACAATLLIMGASGIANADPDISRGDRYAGASWATRSPVLAQHGMAATEQPLASLAAVEILKKGGSAVDAAIAANAVLGLLQPVLNGIGGDCFVIVYDPKTH